MTRDDIIRMARDAGLVGLEQGGVLENFERFAALVAAAEREACALIIQRAGLPSIATAIRARGRE
jgi:hypothetical protein